jgi:hypothetical protein
MAVGWAKALALHRSASKPLVRHAHQIVALAQFPVGTAHAMPDDMELQCQRLCPPYGSEYVAIAWRYWL